MAHVNWLINIIKRWHFAKLYCFLLVLMRKESFIYVHDLLLITVS